MIHDDPDYLPTDPELRAYYRGNYAEGAAFIDICECLNARPCTGNGCDLGAPCDRHQRTGAVATRYQRLKRKAREEF